MTLKDFLKIYNLVCVCVCVCAGVISNGISVWLPAKEPLLSVILSLFVCVTIFPMLLC